MSCHTFQSSNSGLSLPVLSPALIKFKPLSTLLLLSLNFLSLLSQSLFFFTAFPVSQVFPSFTSSPSLSLHSLVYFSLPLQFHSPSLRLQLRHWRQRRERAPLSEQCSLKQGKCLTVAYWHGVSHHPGSAQLPGRCCCGLCVSSSRIGRACTWSPANRRGHQLLTFRDQNKTFLCFVFIVQVDMFWTLKDQANWNLNEIYFMHLWMCLSIDPARAGAGVCLSLTQNTHTPKISQVCPHCC